MKSNVKKQASNHTSKQTREEPAPKPLGIVLSDSRPVQITDGNGNVLLTLCRGLGGDVVVSFEAEIPVALHNEIWQGNHGPYPVITAEYEVK